MASPGGEACDSAAVRRAGSPEKRSGAEQTGCSRQAGLQGVDCWLWQKIVISSLPLTIHLPLVLLANPQASRTAGVSMVTNKPMNALPFLEAASCQSSGLPGAEAGFDPLYFSDFLDIKWLREAELKHGRICMLYVPRPRVCFLACTRDSPKLSQQQQQQCCNTNTAAQQQQPSLRDCRQTTSSVRQKAALRRDSGGKILRDDDSDNAHPKGRRDGRRARRRGACR